MFNGLRKRRQNREIVDRLYGSIVDRARRPELYAEGGLPDTVMGRFEGLGLEMFLFLHRCRDDAALAALSQDLVDRFMLDVDHSIRELGVGYLAVPKRMRKLAGQFYGRVGALREPLAERDEGQLAAALRDSVLRDVPDVPAGAEAFLARHLLQADGELARWPSEAILRGELPAADEEGR